MSRAKAVRWTAIEDNVLFNNGATLNTKGLQELLPNPRSEGSIKGRLQTLGIRKENLVHQNPWTEEEDETLREWFHVIGAQTTQHRYFPNRPLVSIYGRANLLGLSTRSKTLPAEDLDMILILFTETTFSIREIAEKFEVAVPWMHKLCWSELERAYASENITIKTYYQTKVLRCSKTKDRSEALDRYLQLELEETKELLEC